ncbi:restriction endonuclease subunit S [bacterium]|nr:restriction endonuclease subunit S [bacterium]
MLTLQRRWLTPELDGRYVEIGVRSFGRGIFHKAPVTGADLGSKRVLRIEPGDLVLMNVFAWEGAVAVARGKEAGTIGSHRYATYTPDSGRCSAEFLNLFFKTERGRDLLRRVSPGSAGRNRTLNLARFGDQIVPLPTLDEQQRIVAQIDAIAAKVAEAQRLRQEATEQTHALTDGLTARLLWFTNAPRVPIGSFAEVRGGIQKTPSRTATASPVRYLTVAHVQRDRILTRDPRYFEVTPDELERWRLKAGDVLVIEGNGSAEQIGRTALFRGEIPDCVHQNHVIRVRTKSDLADPAFLNAFLNSSVGRDVIQAESRTTSGLRTLSVGRIKALSVPLPPLSKQKAALQELEEVLCRVTALKAFEAEVTRELDGFLPGVLHRAFGGEL